MEQLHFKTNVQIKSIIGKDLINDDNIAILELVKNSFDADAKRVDISFCNLKSNDDNQVEQYTDKTSRLIIQDDGVGMNLADIQDKWLNIAYSEKKVKNRQYNRLMAGAKGVGRFSCDRLGKYLNLYSKKSGNECVVLKIDWGKFEVDNQNKEIQSIALEYEIVSDEELQKRGISLFDHGTILEIIKLRSNWVSYSVDKWLTDKLTNLKKYLEKLINPSQAFEKNDFGIYLNADEFKFENIHKDESNQFIGKIENTIFKKLDFKTTSIECITIEDGKQILTTLKDKGETIYWIKEISDFYPSIKNLKITLYFLNTYAKAFFTKQTGIRSVDYGSVFLFLNGFRISPYGEEGDDWLKLEQRRAQGYARFISARDLVGQIEILDTDDAFKIVSSREGLVKNDNFDLLTDRKKGLFYRNLRRLERYVVDGLNWDSIPDEDRNKIAEIEKKIIRGELTEDNLRYQEGVNIKQNRIYESIHSIIGATPKKVVELYINETLIESKIAEEKEIAEREFKQLLVDFENKKISGELLAQVLRKKAAESDELDKQLSAFSKYTTNEATSKAITEIETYKKTIEEQTRIIEILQKQLEDKDNEIQNIKKEVNERVAIVEFQKKEEERKRIAAEQAKQIVESELEKEKKQVLFHRSIIGREKEQILGLQHQINHSASRIKNNIKNLIIHIKQNEIHLDPKIQKYLSIISLESTKIESLSTFITNANFDLKASEITQNIVQFIKEYIEEIYLPDVPILKTTSQIKVFCFISEHIMRFRPLEITTLIDNFVQNAEKAGAKRIVFEIGEKGGKLQLQIFNDGKSIPHEDISHIFDLGFTTTNGSGIGLFTVKSLVERLKGNISVESNDENGVKFNIII